MYHVMMDCFFGCKTKHCILGCNPKQLTMIGTTDSGGFRHRTLRPSEADQPMLGWATGRAALFRELRCVGEWHGLDSDVSLSLAGYAQMLNDPDLLSPDLN